MRYKQIIVKESANNLSKKYLLEAYHRETFALLEQFCKEASKQKFTAREILEMFEDTELDASNKISDKLQQGKEIIDRAKTSLEQTISQSGEKIENFDEKFDVYAEKLGKKFPNLNKLIHKFREFAHKHPIAEHAILIVLSFAAAVNIPSILGAAIVIGILTTGYNLILGKKLSHSLKTGAASGIISGALGAAVHSLESLAQSTRLAPWAIKGIENIAHGSIEGKTTIDDKLANLIGAGAQSLSSVVGPAIKKMKESIDLPGAPKGMQIMTPQQFVAKNAKNEQEVEEATKLSAPTRPIDDKELTDYLDRIRNKEKKKTDKYNLPYIHRSSVISYYSETGKKYDIEAIKGALKTRPQELLKKNEKMKHSDGTTEQFFNIGFAALVGIALDEETNELIVVNTCPGAGPCKIDCFAMKGGKIQFAGPWLSDGRILTYLLNDPSGFFNQLKREISTQVEKGGKKGYKVSIRWHDAGDFFSPEYVNMAFKLATELPMVDFYAYTKIADVALGNKPNNFMINWSEGAYPSQERKIKAQDPKVIRTKNSRIVPNNLFYDLLVKDENKNLVKGPEGQWQIIPEKLPELKQRIAKEYGLSANSILSYSEWDAKTNGGKKDTPLRYNVIITPGEPDITAKSQSVISTLLLKH